MEPTPPSSPSSRVRLEIAFLDDDRFDSVPDALDAIAEHPRLTVLVVAAEADVRRYVRECLRERTDLRVVEASSAGAAAAAATDHAPHVLVVDEHEAEVVAMLPDLPGVVLVDEIPRATRPSAVRLRLLARPFTAGGLVAELVQVLKVPLR